MPLTDYRQLHCVTESLTETCRDWSESGLLVQAWDENGSSRSARLPQRGEGGGLTQARPSYQHVTLRVKRGFMALADRRRQPATAGSEAEAA